jgi:hypothetical protein
MTKQRQAGITKSGEILWAVTFANAAMVFAPGHVANPMQPIFYSPVTATKLKQLPSACSVSTNACDRVRHICRPLAADDASSLNPNRLGEPGPGQITLQPRTGL